jgi:uncharacterized integral membrane protein
VRKGEAMRLLRFLFFYVPLAVCGVILSLFLTQNWRPVQLDLFGLQYSISLAWVLVGAMALGALVAAIFMLPGRLAATLRAWSLERELQRWERDLWRLQERRERLLMQHERLLEAHERMLLAHQDLVEEHSLVVTERDEARAQVDAGRALPAHQPAREPIPLARVAGASATSAASFDSSDSPVAAAAIASPAEPRPRSLRGGRGSASQPHWAAPSPAARPASDIVSEAVGDEVAYDAGEQPVAPGRAKALPAPPQAVAEPPSPRSAPLRLAEPSSASPVTAVSPATALAASSLSPSPHHAVAVGSSASRLSLLTMLRSRMRADIAESAATLAALRDALASRRVRLTRTLYQGKAPVEPSGGSPDDLPGGDNRD